MNRQGTYYVPISVNGVTADVTGDIAASLVMRVMTKSARNAIKHPKTGMSVIVKDRGRTSSYLSFWDGSNWRKIATEID
jgi:hypothetical protein